MAVKTKKPNTKIVNKLVDVKKSLFSGKNKKKSLLVLSAALLLGLLYLGKGFIVAAVVNGEPVYRTEVISEMEKNIGDQVLQSLVTKKIILQKARENNIYITDEQVNVELDKTKKAVEGQGLTLENALAMQGGTLEAYTENLRIKLMIEKLMGSEINVTDEQVQAEFDTNKGMYGAEASFDDMKDSIKDQLYQQQLSEKYNQWLTNAQQDSSIKYFVQYK
jgi:foldase protein PrsA